jgi:hypothetical protein
MTLNMSSIFPPGRQSYVNYNWSDIASATGYVTYVGFGSITSAATSYVLFNSALASNFIGSDGLIEKSQTGDTSTSFQKYYDLNFDLSENQVTQTIKGTGYARVEFNIAAGGSTCEAYLIVKVHISDGVTTEVIATTQTQTGQATGGTNTDISAILPLTFTGTTIKKGEVLRIEVEGWQRSVSGGTPTLTFRFDPRDTGDNSKFYVAIPYKIEV